MINNAISYLQSGLSVIPVKVETKSPTVQWKDFQRTRMTEAQAWAAFGQADGIALIGGKISGGVVIIDFDNHFGDADKTIRKFELLIDCQHLVKQKTQSGGYHLCYRTSAVEKNRKLASRINKAGKPDTIIETRGEGGYALIAPSPGYTLERGDFTNLPTISPEDHAELMEVAQSFNEHIRADKNFTHEFFSQVGDRPGDEYNQSRDGRDEVPVLLTRAGWKTADGRHWRRPGKDRGISATFGKVAPGWFYVFSTNASPFDSEKAYSPFQVFALLAHNGNFDDAARELKQRGFGKTSQGKKDVFKAAITHIREGVDIGRVNFNELSEKLDIEPDAIQKEFSRIYEANADEFDLKKKTPIEKAEIYIRKNYELRKNIINLKIEWKTPIGWEPINDNTIYCDFQRNGINYAFDKLKALLRSNFVPEYDPFKEYFMALPQWDGVDYIQELCDHFKGVDTQWLALMLKKHMVRAIKCAIEDEYYNRFVFVLFSIEQEIGKSWLFKWLCPFAPKYYTAEPLGMDKDSKFRLSENFIYNLEELDHLSKQDVSWLKSFISKSDVNDRVPYADQKIRMPRRCTFFGSTNRNEFLIDDKNTRWLVFKVTDIDQSYSKKLNINDLWAEAFTLYKDPDFDCELTGEERAWRDRENKSYQVQDIERTIIIQNIEPSYSTDQFMTIPDIVTMLNYKTNNTVKTTSQKIGRIMSELGYQTSQRWIDGRNYRIYYCRMTDPIANMRAPF